jgi:hypothetical protein
MRKQIKHLVRPDACKSGNLAVEFKSHIRKMPYKQRVQDELLSATVCIPVR